jgi:hypothetical protein
VHLFLSHAVTPFSQRWTVRRHWTRRPVDQRDALAFAFHSPQRVNDPLYALADFTGVGVSLVLLELLYALFQGIL